MSVSITDSVSPLCSQIFKGQLQAGQPVPAITSLFSGIKEILAHKRSTPEQPEELPAALGHKKKWASFSALDKSLCIIFMATLQQDNTRLEEALNSISEDASPLAEALKAFSATPPQERLTL